MGRVQTVLVAFWSRILAAWPACADTAIVVNFGPYPSAEAAGHAEAQVNWLDADPPTTPSAPSASPRWSCSTTCAR